MGDPNLMQTMMSWTRVARDQRLTPVIMLTINEKTQGMMIVSPAFAQQAVSVHGTGHAWPDDVRKLADDLLEAVAKHLGLATEG